MEKLDKLEEELLKLMWIYVRLTTIHITYPVILQKAEERNELRSTGEIRSFTSVIRETIIVQLDNFNIIRKHLNKDAKVRKIDACLKPL